MIHVAVHNNAGNVEKNAENLKILLRKGFFLLLTEFDLYIDIV